MSTRRRSEYGVDHVKAAEAFGCPRRARLRARGDRRRHRLGAARERGAAPAVIVEIITEAVTDIAMGAEIDAITEFEEVIDLPAAAALEPFELTPEFGISDTK